MSKKTVAIVGASRDAKKYSHKAVKAFLKNGYKVYPVNPHSSKIADLDCFADLEDLPEKVEEISIYVPPYLTIGILQTLVDYPVKKIYLNPGSADDIVRSMAEKLNLPIVEACSIRSQGQDPDML